MSTPPESSGHSDEGNRPEPQYGSLAWRLQQARRPADGASQDTPPGPSTGPDEEGVYHPIPIGGQTTGEAGEPEASDPDDDENDNLPPLISDNLRGQHHNDQRPERSHFSPINGLVIAVHGIGLAAARLREGYHGSRRTWSRVLDDTADKHVARVRSGDTNLQDALAVERDWYLSRRARKNNEKATRARQVQQIYAQKPYGPQYASEAYTRKEKAQAKRHARLQVLAGKATLSQMRKEITNIGAKPIDHSETGRHYARTIEDKRTDKLARARLSARNHQAKIDRRRNRPIPAWRQELSPRDARIQASRVPIANPPNPSAPTEPIPDIRQITSVELAYIAEHMAEAEEQAVAAEEARLGRRLHHDEFVIISKQSRERAGREYFGTQTISLGVENLLRQLMEGREPQRRGAQRVPKKRARQQPGSQNKAGEGAGNRPSLDDEAAYKETVAMLAGGLKKSGTPFTRLSPEALKTALVDRGADEETAQRVYSRLQNEGHIAKTYDQDKGYEVLTSQEKFEDIRDNLDS